MSFKAVIRHGQQAIDIPTIESEGPLAGIRFDSPVKAKGLDHINCEALQFVKLVPGFAWLALSPGCSTEDSRVDAPSLTSEQPNKKDTRSDSHEVA